MFLLDVSGKNANESENILIYSTRFCEKSLYITTKNNTIFPYTITLYANLLNGKVNKNKIKIKVYLTQHINVKFKLVINIQITEFFFVLSSKAKLLTYVCAHTPLLQYGCGGTTVWSHKMAHKIKDLATKPVMQSSIPVTHMAGGEN